MYGISDVWEQPDREACHYPKLFTCVRFLSPLSGLMNLAVGFNPRLLACVRFLSPRSGLMNLAVGFNPRLLARNSPRRVATVEPVEEIDSARSDL